MIARHHVTSWGKERDLNQIMVLPFCPLFPIWVNTEASVREALSGCAELEIMPTPAKCLHAHVHVCFGGPSGNGHYFRACDAKRHGRHYTGMHATLRDRKKGILDYLESEGFSNSGYDSPLPANAMTCIKIFLAEGPSLNFWQVHRKIRDQGLREALESLPFVQMIPGSTF